MKRILLFIFFVMVLCACSSSDEPAPPRIGLATHELTVNASSGEQSIQTDYDHWWMIGGLTIDEQGMNSFKNTTYTYTPIPGQIEDITVFRDTIYGEWFTVIKDANELKVKVEANQTGKEKKLILYLNAGNIPQETFTLIQTPAL